MSFNVVPIVVLVSLLRTRLLCSAVTISTLPQTGNSMEYNVARTSTWEPRFHVRIIHHHAHWLQSCMCGLVYKIYVKWKVLSGVFLISWVSLISWVFKCAVVGITDYRWTYLTCQTNSVKPYTCAVFFMFIYPQIKNLVFPFEVILFAFAKSCFYITWLLKLLKMSFSSLLFSAHTWFSYFWHIGWTFN